MRRCDAILIWERKYKDNTALVATSKVKEGAKECFIYFAMDSLDKLYSFDGIKAREGRFPIVWNGKIYCYAVPISELKECGELTKGLLKRKERAKIKYRMSMVN